MKKNRILYNIVWLAGLSLFACDDYLDEKPDNRTEVDTPEKVTKMLVSAYSETLPVLVHEQMSDNVTDRGTVYGWSDSNCEDAYLLHDQFTSTSQDSPYALWESNYKAIAAANTALAAIEEMGDAAGLSAQKGEALLCRAYAHFTLCNVFCQAYNPQSSTTDLGIPYVYDVEETAFNHYERGTVAEVYEKIASDIEAGLPLIDDNLYDQPKYHFNKAAANAFAAQFYLFYGRYERAAACATAAIGTDPSGMMRTYDDWDSFTGGEEYTNAWVNSKLPCNLLLQGIGSLAGRMGYRSQAVHTKALLAETEQSFGPWGNGYLVFGDYMRYYSGTVPSYIFPKQMEYFVYSDQVQGIGRPYIMNVAYSAEKTLLNRAEAYVMMGEYDLAASDLSCFYLASRGDNGIPEAALDAATIAGFYENASEMYKKPIASRFPVGAGMQENMLHACLHARRILTLHEGTRLLDLKRYGIAYTHIVDKGTNLSIEPYDARLAVQIPNLVIEAGMEANPR